MSDRRSLVYPVVVTERHGAFGPFLTLNDLERFENRYLFLIGEIGQVLRLIDPSTLGRWALPLTEGG